MAKLENRLKTDDHEKILVCYNCGRHGHSSVRKSSGYHGRR